MLNLKKITLITIALLFSLTACQNAQENQAEHDAKIAAQAKAELRAELKAEQEAKVKQHEITVQKNSKLAHMGITTDNGKLIIDTNKTKSFFQQMAENFKVRADKFAKDFKDGNINDPEAGIVVSDSHVNIDLNKTKSFLDTWGKTIESYVKEFDKLSKDINSSK